MEQPETHWNTKQLLYACTITRMRDALMMWERWCNETAFSEIDNLSATCATEYRRCRDEGRRALNQAEASKPN